MASATTEWLAFLLMTVGWFVLLTSMLGFWRVKRWERGIRQASEPAPTPTAEDIERDENVRSSLYRVFGIQLEPEEGDLSEPSTANSRRLTPAEEERRLERDLRASGLL